MSVCDIKTGEAVTVEKVELSDGLRERLKYQGVAAGAPLVLLKVSLFKKVYLIQVRSAKIAVGRDVAEGIKVCKK